MVQKLIDLSKLQKTRAVPITVGHTRAPCSMVVGGGKASVGVSITQRDLVLILTL